jgi:hypothetical protein
MSRWTKAGVLLAAIAGGIALVAHVQAGADKVAFPENYAKGVKWVVIDRVKTNQVHEHFAVPAAIEAARKDQTMPSGTVFTGVRYSAQLDAQHNPIRGSDGHFVKDKLLGFVVMEKRTGWGSEYPDALRNGEWEYRSFTADKKPDGNANLKACFECHKPQANHDFIFAYDELKKATQQSP